jgi:aryl-alcohol dehydrogenase-like predicted oxidoreductase
METRYLANGELRVAPLGLGCMSMSGIYADAGDERESISVIRHALDEGYNLLSTSDLYGPYTNEELIGRALVGRRDQAVIATMFGLVMTADGSGFDFDSSPDHIRQACDASLRRLGTDYIDLYFQHRTDPRFPIEETVGVMGELVAAGKVKHIGLSEVSPDTLRRAHATHPIAAVQSELSLFARDIEDDVLPAMRELGVGLVAYSPIGRGLLTGRWRQQSDLSDDDYRNLDPRFQGENLNRNIELVRRLEEMAAEKGCTSSQLAIAWVLAQGDDIVPIAGTRRLQYFKENLAATEVSLSENDLARLDKSFYKGVAHGDRFGDMSFVNR